MTAPAAPAASKPRNSPSAGTGFSRVLVGIDLSLSGDRALRRTGRLPLLPNATITVAHVLPGDLAAAVSSVVTEVAMESLEEARAKLGDLLERRGRRDIAVRARLVRGDPATELARLAQSRAAELVVVGRGGSRLSGTMLGSTAQRVARQARVPVLLVRGNPTAPYRRIVLGVDLSQDAIRAARLTGRISGVPPAKVSVVHAYLDPRSDLAPTLFKAIAKARWRTFAPVLAEQARRVRRILAAAGVSERWSLSFKSGDPRRRLLESAVAKRAELVVVGSRSRSGLPRLVLGSVAEAVLTLATCDVLVSPRRRWDS